MERMRQRLKWDQRTELAKTVFLLIVVIGGTLAGYGVFMLGLGTTTPLVVVTSESMVPTLEVNDLLVLQGRAPEDIAVNDIIVFRASWYAEAPIVHRVVSIEEVNGTYRYYTRGDNNPSQDFGYRTYEDIVGVLVWRIPQVGGISLFLRTWPGMLFMAAVFIAILIVPEFVCKDKEEDEEVPQERTESLSSAKEPATDA